MEKNEIMFDEDDPDYEKLKSYAMGNPNPVQKGNSNEYYPKVPVTAENENEKDIKVKLSLNSLELERDSKLEEKKVSFLILTMKFRLFS